MLVANPKTGQFTITLNSGLPIERQRFNIGHEITHTFFPDCADTVRLRGGGSEHRDSVVEALCDLGASEMLFPIGPFTRDARTFGGPSFEALVQLRHLYQASWEATANRLVSTADVPCAMVVLSLRLRPTQERGCSFLPGFEPSRKLRVDYSVRSRPLAARFVPKDKSIEDHSVLYGLVGTDPVDYRAAAVEDWSDLNLGTVEVHGLRLATADEQVKLLAFLKPA